MPLALTPAVLFTGIFGCAPPSQLSHDYTPDAQMVFGEGFEEPAGTDGASGSAPWLVEAIPGCFGTSQGPTWRTVRGAPTVSTSTAYTGNASQRLPSGAAVENSGLLGIGMWWEAIRGQPVRSRNYHFALGHQVNCGCDRRWARRRRDGGAARVELECLAAR
jgi:hypothetical protein